MFIEPQRITGGGWIEVISGCMFSGKTEELIRRLKRVQLAGQRVEIFKPALDTRYHISDIVSHDHNRIHCTPVRHLDDILLLSSGMQVVGIDEAQFFEDGIVEIIEQLALTGVRVIVAGLDKDYLGRPFGPMGALLARAEYVTKLHAICRKCGHNASYSNRKPKIDGQVLLGEKDVYEPLCRNCFYER